MKKCFRKMHLKLGMEKGEWRPLQAKTVVQTPLERRKGLRRVGARRKEKKWKKANTFHMRQD